MATPDSEEQKKTIYSAIVADCGNPEVKFMKTLNCCES